MDCFVNNHQNQKLDEALALAINGQLQESKQILLSLDQSDPRVRFNMGWHELSDGNWKKGYEDLDWGRKINVFGGTKNPFAPIYDGSSLKEKTVLFCNEGGFGDEIINVRFVHQLKNMGANVILGCEKSLYPIFKQIPGVSAMVDKLICIHVYHDYWIPAMSAPKYLNLEYKDLTGTPYLNFFNKPRWLPGKKNKFKVGLRWAGNPKFEHEQHRKFPIEKMVDLLDIKECDFYSLQRDNDLLPDCPFIDLQYEMKTWLDTAEIISNMDLVITSCTAIGHLAGAMGKPVWILVPILPYYIWSLPGNKSPWYDSATLYRQEVYGNWDKPFENIKRDLQKLVS